MIGCNMTCDVIVKIYISQEPRVSIRLTLLQIFGAVCGLDAQFISHLLCTVLPVELSRDILSETKGKM